MQAMDDVEIREFLAEETIFHGAAEDGLERLAALARLRVVPEGDMLFSMGRQCSDLHFVVEGRGLLVKFAPDGRQRILHGAVPGDMVGCIPFFDGGEYPASFIAQSECLVMCFARDRLLDLLGAEPTLALSIVGGLVKRMGMLSTMVEQMSFADAAHRLWDYLVKTSLPERVSTATDEKGGALVTSTPKYPRVIEPLPTREHIANVIGTVREVVSRRLSRLSDSGHITIEGRRLVLVKPFE